MSRRVTSRSETSFTSMSSPSTEQKSFVSATEKRNTSNSPPQKYTDAASRRGSTAAVSQQSSRPRSKSISNTPQADKRPSTTMPESRSSSSQPERKPNLERRASTPTGQQSRKSIPQANPERRRSVTPQNSRPPLSSTNSESKSVEQRRSNSNAADPKSKQIPSTSISTPLPPEPPRQVAENPHNDASMPSSKRVSLAPEPPPPSSASSQPSSPVRSSVVQKPQQESPKVSPRSSTATAEESVSPVPSRAPSSLPRAPKRRRSDDVSIVIPPPPAEFRRLSSDSEEHKPSPRRLSLLSKQARRSSTGNGDKMQGDPGSRRSSLSDRLKRTASPPARDQMALRDRAALLPTPEESRRRSSIIETHYGLDQPLTAGHGLFIVLSSMALMITYGFKLDLIPALDRMTNHSAPTRNRLNIEQIGICPDRGYTMFSRNGPFIWRQDTQRTLLRSFHLGYMLSGVPGAILAEKCSAKWVLVSGGSVMLFSAMITPIISIFPRLYSAEIFNFILMLQGVGGGVMMPAVTTLLSKWTTRRHRSVYAGLVYGGIALGPMFGALAEQITMNLPWTFTYHFLVLGILPWLLVVAFWLEDDTGHSDRCVPVRDHMLVMAEQANIRSFDNTISFPYEDVIKSFPFWALMLMHFSGNVGFYTSSTLVPLYMKEVLRYNVREYMVLVVVPYLAMFFISITAGLAIDVGRHHGVLSTTNGRRFAAFFGVLFPAVSIVTMTFIECNVAVAVGAYLVGIATSGAHTVGWLANHLDISPNFAGPLMAITNTVATIPYLFWPSLIAIIREGSVEAQLRDKWAMTFQGVAGIYFLSFIIYILVGTAMLQKWNNGRTII